MTVVAPPIHYFDRVDSTQDVAHRLAAEGAGAGTAVVAVEQSAGRGSRGRSWASERGGLWLSVVWRPAETSGAEGLSIRAALALAEALEAAGTPRVAVKWPNDLMLADRKVGGILCEARWTGERLGWVVAGAGINVTNWIPPELAAVACRLGDFGPFLAPELAPSMVESLRQAGARGGPLDASELAAFERRDWLGGRQLASPVPGYAAGLAPDGALRIQTADGTISLVRTGSAVPAVGPHQP